MARFRYRFESLKRIHETVRDEARKRLAEARRALEIIDQRIADTDVEKQALREQRKALLTGTLSVDYLLDQGRYDLQIDVNRRDLQDQRQQIDEEVERRQQRLILAEQECRKFEKLEEIARSEFQAELLRREQAELDELAGQRSLRPFGEAP